jgi:hypothetical protein
MAEFMTRMRIDDASCSPNGSVGIYASVVVADAPATVRFKSKDDVCGMTRRCRIYLLTVKQFDEKPA